MSDAEGGACWLVWLIVYSRACRALTSGNLRHMRDEQDAKTQQAPEERAVEALEARGEPEYTEDDPPGATDFMRATKDAAKLLKNQEP